MDMVFPENGNENQIGLMSGIKFIGKTRDCVGFCRADEGKRGGEKGTKETLDPETRNEAADGKWHSATEMETKALLRPIKNLCVTVLPVAASLSFAKVLASPHPCIRS